MTFSAALSTRPPHNLTASPVDRPHELSNSGAAPLLCCPASWEPPYRLPGSGDSPQPVSLLLPLPPSLFSAHLYVCLCCSSALVMSPVPQRPSPGPAPGRQRPMCSCPPSPLWPLPLQPPGLHVLPWTHLVTPTFELSCGNIPLTYLWLISSHLSRLGHMAFPRLGHKRHCNSHLSLLTASSGGSQLPGRMRLGTEASHQEPHEHAILQADPPAPIRPPDDGSTP